MNDVNSEIHDAPALRTAAICFLFTLCTGMTTARNVVIIAMTSMMTRSKTGNSTYKGSSTNMQNCEETSKAVR